MDATDTTIKQMAELAEQAATAFLTSGEWQSFLAWNSKFWNYSFGNQMLIFSQCEHATRVASYKTWQSLGRQVKNGERAIKIIAPRPWKKESENGEEKRGIYFAAASVFDISQTEGDAPPAEPTERNSELDASNPAVTIWFDALREKLDEAGVGLSFVPQRADGAGGWWDPAAKRISICEHENRANVFRVLLHESAHMIADHKYERDGREHAEVQAEMATCIAAGVLGFDTGAMSASYVGHWAGDLATMRQNADTAQKIAKDLLMFMGVRARKESE